MQVGLATRRLTFREVFSSMMLFLALRNVTFAFFDSCAPQKCHKNPLASCSIIRPQASRVDIHDATHRGQA